MDTAGAATDPNIATGPWFDARMNNPEPWWLTWPVEEVAAAILPLFSRATHAYEGDAVKGVVS